MTRVDRRKFLSLSTVAAGAWAVRALGQDSRPAASRPAESRPSGSLETVAIGSTKFTVPRLGLGCFPLSTLAGDEDGAAVVRRALELGVRYLDTAPSYGNGASERRIGLALDASKRSEIYIATKTLERGADGARREVEASLKRLRTNYVDCVQVHEVHDDWESLFKKGSVLEGLEKCRQEGIVKHIGLTGHRDPAFLRHAVERHPFVSALVPVNPIDPQHLSFVRDFLPFAAERGVAVIAMKLFAGGRLVREKLLTAKECLDYGLSLPQVAVVVPGCATIQELEEAHAAAISHRTLPRQSLDALEKKAGQHHGKDSEWYKDGQRK